MDSMNFLLIILSLASCSAYKSECTRDSECGDTYYCAQGVCEPCIPCQDLYNRQPSSGPRQCAKSEIDCGSCLAGFQAEELTDFRYSFKCSAVPTEETQSFTAEFLNTFKPEVVAYVVACIVVSVVVLGFLFYPRRSTVTRERQDEEKCVPLMGPPPPYAPSAPQDPETESLVQVVAVEPPTRRVVAEERVRAVPIGPYYHQSGQFVEQQYFYPAVSQVNFEDDNSQIVGDLNVQNQSERADDSDADSFNSTETIPSLWEPGSTPQLNESRPVQISQQTDRLESCPTRPRFSRSVSLDSANERRNRWLRNPTGQQNSGRIFAQRPSLPDTCQGVNSGIHVQLASQRNRLGSASNGNMTDIVSSMTGCDSDGADETLTVDACRPCKTPEPEPEPPQPFNFIDENRRPFLFRSISATSYADSANSRRRPAPDVIEFSLRFSVKRIREDDPSSQ